MKVVLLMLVATYIIRNKSNGRKNMKLYSITLYPTSLYGNEKWVKAEQQFRRLVGSDYFRMRGFWSEAPEALPCKLQFNSLRYLGFILAKRQEGLEECIDCLERATRIDKTDVTLFFKVGKFATN